MQRIDDIEQAFGVFDDQVVSTDENRFRMRREELFTIRSANDERARPGQLLANDVSIHRSFVNPGERPVKRGVRRIPWVRMLV